MIALQITRFADDVLLFATSLEQLQKMICEFKQSTEKVGLQIYPGKTNTICNQSSNKRREVPIDNIKVETLTKKKKVQNILDKWLHSSNKRQPRPRMKSGLPGRRSANTSKS